MALGPVVHGLPVLPHRILGFLATKKSLLLQPPIRVVSTFVPLLGPHGPLMVILGLIIRVITVPRLETVGAEFIVLMPRQPLFRIPYRVFVVTA